MRHTDVLMKVKPDTYAEEEEKRKKEINRNLDVLQTHLRIVDQLAKSDGWKLFQTQLQADEYKVMRLIETTRDPVDLAKLVGSLLMLRSFANWPTDTMVELDAQAQALAKS